MFPIIKHIDDVLPHIEGVEGFIVAKRDGYTVIDYQTITEKGMFDNPYRLECRGLKFDESGKIIARPFHKFFNLGEKETLADIDLSYPHIIMDKLDGSMIHPAIVRGELLPMTRMGYTDVAKQAWEYANADMLEWCSVVSKNGMTPVFEFTGPSNRIVLPYDDHRLTLLAIRDNETGAYMPDIKVWEYAENNGFYCSVGDFTYQLSERFVGWAKDKTGIEGYVVRFANGHMLKIKTEEYVLQHRAKDSIGLEKNALLAVLDGRVDDLVSLLPREDGIALQAYAIDVWNYLSPIIVGLKERVDKENAAYVDRKTFALSVQANYQKWTHSIFYKHRDHMQDVSELALETLRRFCSTATTVKRFRELCPGLPNWHYYHSGAYKIAA